MSSIRSGVPTCIVLNAGGNCTRAFSLFTFRRDYLHQMTSGLGPEIVNVHCMYPHCKAKLNYKNIEKLADPYDCKRYNCVHQNILIHFFRYSYFFLKHFSESDPRIMFCPNPICGNAAQYHGTGKPSDVVECHCGTRFW